jgi:uncharacterized Tic20 family protein
MFIPVSHQLRQQAGVICLVVVVAGLWAGLGTALALLYGGLVAVANGALLVWRWHKGARDFHCDAGRHLRSFYRSALERFLVVLVLLAAGFALTGGHRIALLAGFAVGQLAWILTSLTLRERN